MSNKERRFVLKAGPVPVVLASQNSHVDLRDSSVNARKLSFSAPTLIAQRRCGVTRIYVFDREVLIDALANDFDDVGKHIIPASLRKYKVFAYIFQEYWEDIRTHALGKGP
jgi:ADP-glucose pyrophosphorylase